METKPEQLEAASVAGYQAFYQGAKYTANPYTGYLADEWSEGWLAADDDLSRDSMRHSPEAQAMLDPGAQNGN